MLFCLWLHFDPLYASKEVKYDTSLREEEYVDKSECRFLFYWTDLCGVHSLSLSCSTLTWYFSNSEVNVPLLQACGLN